MAFPTFNTPVSTSFGVAATNMQVNMPASVAAGDLLIVLVESRNAVTWTKPSGWNDISTLAQAGGSSVGQLNGFYKIAAGTEAGTTPQWTASGVTTAIWNTFKVTTWHGTTPPEATTTNGDSSAANPPNLAPSWGADDTLWVAIAGHAASTASAWSAGPSGYGNFQCNGASTGGAAVSMGIATLTNNASSENPGAFTVNGGGNNNRWWAAATLAVRPAGASSAIKTVNGLAKASVKTFNGLAIASVKNINGLA